MLRLARARSPPPDIAPASKRSPPPDIAPDIDHVLVSSSDDDAWGSWRGNDDEEPMPEPPDDEELGDDDEFDCMQHACTFVSLSVGAERSVTRSDTEDLAMSVDKP